LFGEQDDQVVDQQSQIVEDSFALLLEHNPELEAQQVEYEDRVELPEAPKLEELLLLL
jgi:hypothetical protein